jgi:hypothetical protein
METNTLLLIITAVVIVVFVVFILIRNKKDKEDYIRSLNAADDETFLAEKEKEKE